MKAGNKVYFMSERWPGVVLRIRGDVVDGLALQDDHLAYQSEANCDMLLSRDLPIVKMTDIRISNVVERT